MGESGGITRLRVAAYCLGLLALMLTACGSGGRSPSGLDAALGGRSDTLDGPVPKASCGPGSQPETDIQGRVSIEDRMSGRSLEPYTCNMELVGAYDGHGANWQHDWYEDCAYYGTSQGDGEGVQVIDASDPTHPVRTMALTTNAMLDPWESLKVNEKRGLLAGVGPGAIGPLYFDIYDLTGDCSRPQLRASLPVNGIGHEGNWAPDGNTYYGAALFAADITVIDTINPSTPRPIEHLPLLTHGLDVSADGNRLYLANYLAPGNGLEIWDVTGVQNNRPYPVREPFAPVLLGSVYWTDGSAGQHPIPVSIGGKSYSIFVDEGGFGMARIIDISDETNPVVISKMKLEIDMPEAAELREADIDVNESFQYQGHYCDVDRRVEPSVLGCSYFWSGVRIFDIRDPYNPREIAYYNPGGRADEAVGPGSQVGPGAKAGYTTGQVRFIPERSEVWFTDQRHGFLVTRITNGVWPFN